MTQNLHKLLVLAFLGCFLTISAQEINFTQYEMAPVFVNPANSGGFVGTYRVSGIYRDRAPSFPGAYKTPYMDIEVNFGFALRKKDWTTLAISFMDDRAGEIGIGRGGFLAAGAYHIVFGKSNLAIGAQFGGVSQNIQSPQSGKDYYTISGAGGPAGPPSQDLMKLQSGKATYKDISGGLVYTAPLSNKKHMFNIGFAVNHINKPTVSILGSGAVNKLSMLFTASASLKYHLNQKTDLVPMIYSRNLAKPSETVPQCMLSYLFNVEKKVRLNAGFGYRFDDALQFMAGMDYGNLKVQVAYDMTTSGLSKAIAGGPGAYEIGINYIGAITKKPNPKPKVFCPRF